MYSSIMGQTSLIYTAKDTLEGFIERAKSLPKHLFCLNYPVSNLKAYTKVSLYTFLTLIP